MSLLMDALKKAEDDKKKAAEEMKASLEGVAQEAASPPDAAGVSTEPAASSMTLSTGSLSLEPLTGDFDASAASGRNGLSQSVSLERERSEPSLDTAGRELRDDNSPSATRAAGRGEQPLPSYDREVTLPSQRAIQSSLKDYFESSQSVEQFRPAAPSGEVSGSRSTRTGEVVTRVSANTVFTATRRVSLSRTVNLGLAVVLVLAVSLGALWIWSETSLLAPAGTPLAQVAPTPPAPAVPPTPAAAPGPSAPAAAEDTGAASNAPINREAPAETTPPSAIETAETEAAPAAPLPIPPPAEPELPAFDVSKLPTGPLVTRAWVDTSSIRITKTRNPAGIDPRVRQGYSAYARGDYRGAEAAYRATLAQQPDHRDALLGVAAVASQTGRRAEAQGYYERVVRLYPRDAVALAALANLKGRGAAPDSESRLKLLLDQTPDASPLHFSLGSLYAKQGRWAEAQEAYFKAYAKDERNPDYVFNLAVSLDRMGQSRTALAYYRQALQLADRHAAGFNTAQVLTRIRSLSQLASR
ncbi:MAG: tetratricopeptide repeat protein [Gammaproteobacteria bacterium]